MDTRESRVLKVLNRCHFISVWPTARLALQNRRTTQIEVDTTAASRTSRNKIPITEAYIDLCAMMIIPRSRPFWTTTSSGRYSAADTLLILGRKGSLQSVLEWVLKTQTLTIVDHYRGLKAKPSKTWLYVLNNNGDIRIMYVTLIIMAKPK